MQPAAYLLARLLLSWLQHLEKDAHAFINSPQTVIAAGAGHCWAVSYALFVAVLVRAVRYERHIHGHFSHNKEPLDLLPWWVLAAERLSATAMVAWWFVGSVLFLLRLVEEDNQFLPATKHDAGLPAVVNWARSPFVRAGLAFLQALCSAALFLGTGTLAVALLIMQGTITGSELALVFVSFGFALPFSGMTCLRFQSLRKLEGATALQAMASEAASLGPQLVVLLSLADMSGAAHQWQGAVHAAATAGFAASLLACMVSPSRPPGVALPPEMWELLTSAIANVAGIAALILCFPLHGSSLAVGVLVGVGFVVAGASFCVGAVRQSLVELIGPVMPLRSPANKLRPGPKREAVRILARILALASAGAALSNILEQRRRLQAQSAPAYENYEQYAREDVGSESWDHNWDYDEDGIPWHHDVAPLLLRWKDGVELPENSELSAEVAKGLELAEDAVYVQAKLKEHRVVLLGLTVGKDDIETHASKWQTARSQGFLHAWVDVDFPARLDYSECETLLFGEWDEDSNGNSSEGSVDAVEEPASMLEALESEEELSEKRKKATDAAEIKDAKKAACRAWHRWLGHYDMDEDYMGDDPYGDYDSEGFRYPGEEEEDASDGKDST